MKIWAISDTHSYHDLLITPDNMDMVIHAGDSTNYKSWFENQPEFENFLDWFENLNMRYKVLIAGNHDAWATKKYNLKRLEEAGIIYLEHQYLDIEGIKIFGSPYTPTFGDWHFMKDRSKLNKYWEFITKDIDILITHGPPKGILDLSEDKNHSLNFCGDKALLTHVLRVKPQYHIFGHIHNNKECINQGIREYQSIKFMNVSCMTNKEFEKGPSSNGIIFEI